MGNEQSIFNPSCVMDEQFNFAGGQNTVHITKLYDRAEVQVNEPIEFHLPKLIKSFRGRDAELQTLQKWFFTDKQKTAVICGCPGFGKSELAKQFVHQCKNVVTQTNVIWIDAETPYKIRQSFRDLAKFLHLKDADDDTQVKMVYQFFKSKPTIIVFDNAPCIKDIVKFEPDGNDSCICLVTSHVLDWGDDVPSLALSPLSQNAAMDVLRAVLQKRFQNKDIKLYQRLTEVLSCVPLALQVAAAYVRLEFNDLGEHFNLSEYVDRLQVPSEQVLDQPLPDSSTNTYERSFLNAMQISLNKIKNSNHRHAKLACDILHICAYLYSEKILLSDLLNVPYLNELLKNYKTPTNELRSSCALLRNYLFISFEEDQISIHGLIQNSVILDQKHVFKNSHNQFYVTCLEFLLFNTENSNYHRQSILKYSEYHLSTFKFFYSNHKSKIISVITFFRHVIKANCKIFLNEILKELGNFANKIINSRCLLHEAVMSQQHDVLDLLLVHKPDMNQRNDQEETCLHVATHKIDFLAIKKLVDHKADVNAIDIQKNTVLHQLVHKSGAPYNFYRSSEALKTLRWLVTQGASTETVGWHDMTLLHVAAVTHNIDLIPHLIKDFKQDVNAVDKMKQTALHKVCDVTGVDKNRVLGTTSCLLENGARLDLVDNYGQTAIERARSVGFEYVAAYLENPTKLNLQMSKVVDELRASVTSGDTESLTRQLDELGDRALQIANECYLLHMAARHQKREVLLMLLSRGVDVNNRDNAKHIALFDSSWELNLQIMQDLVAHGAEVNAINIRGESALYALIGGTGLVRRVGHDEETCEALRFLVKEGANIDIVSFEGWTLLHEAAWALSADLVRFLVNEYSASVDVKDIYGWTPLFRIITGLLYWQVDEARGVSVAACLLELGASRDVVNAQGLTAAQVARSEQLEKLAAFLENHGKNMKHEETNTQKIQDIIANMLKCQRKRKRKRVANGRRRKRKIKTC